MQYETFQRPTAAFTRCRGVSFDIRAGEVHALVGENGAGKSTLVKIVSGVVDRDGGVITLDGNEVTFSSPREALEGGISIIHQELSMLPDLNVIENIYMGRLGSTTGVIDWRDLAERTRAALATVELDIHPQETLARLSISERQLVEIAKAVDRRCKVLIMDEPNSSLSEHESEVLFRIIDKLTSAGIAVVYISHKLDEVLSISNRITVLRDGRLVGTVDAEETDVDRLVGMMVGRNLTRSEERSFSSEETILTVSGLSGDRFRDVTFDLRRGEILGFSGLVGAGRSETARAIFGAEEYHSGTVEVDGRPVRFRSPREAIEHGVAMLQEDRKKLSLFMDQSIRANMSMARLPALARRGVIDQRMLDTVIGRFIEALDIRLGTVRHAVSSLSGGNQQKTIIARWLATDPRILILDEPTHGVDVGAKAEIYHMMRDLADRGVSIILISSEMPEIITMSDRVVVMREGRVAAILAHDDINEETIMSYAAAERRQERKSTHDITGTSTDDPEPPLRRPRADRFRRDGGDRYSRKRG